MVVATMAANKAATSINAASEAEVPHCRSSPSVEGCKMAVALLASPPSSRISTVSVGFHGEDSGECIVAEDFNPYHRWLGISPKDLPPNRIACWGSTCSRTILKPSEMPPSDKWATCGGINWASTWRCRRKSSTNSAWQRRACWIERKRQLTTQRYGPRLPRSKPQLLCLRLPLPFLRSQMFSAALTSLHPFRRTRHERRSNLGRFPQRCRWCRLGHRYRGVAALGGWR